MKIKHLLLPVFLAFAAASATADEDKVNSLLSTNYPGLTVDVLEEAFKRNLKERDSGVDGVSITINSVHDWGQGILRFSLDLTISAGSKEHTFRGCKMSSLHTTEVFHFKGCKKRYSREQIVEGFTITRDDLDSIKRY